MPAQTSRIHGEVVAFLGGNPQASVVGQTQKVSIPQAGQINARMANALDLDDCYMNVAHFAPQTVFGALAAGEYRQISGARLLSAVALGYDVAARICLSFMFWRVRRGLIATRGLLACGMYQQRFADAGFDCLVPSDDEVERLFTPGCYAVKAGDVEAGAQLLEAVGDALLERGATHLILGCTEVPLAYERIRSVHLPLCVDTNRALAGACIDAWLRARCA